MSSPRDNSYLVLIIVGLMLSAIIFAAFIVPFMAARDKEEADCAATGGVIATVRIHNKLERACVMLAKPVTRTDKENRK